MFPYFMKEIMGKHCQGELTFIDYEKGNIEAWDKMAFTSFFMDNFFLSEI